MFESSQFNFIRERYPLLLQIQFFILVIIFSVVFIITGICLLATDFCTSQSGIRVCAPRDQSTPLLILFIGVFALLFYFFAIFSYQMTQCCKTQKANLKVKTSTPTSKYQVNEEAIQVKDNSTPKAQEISQQTQEQQA